MSKDQDGIVDSSTKLRLRQRLFQAIHGKDDDALRLIMDETSADLVEVALDMAQDETEHFFSQDWPVTPLSLAIKQGEESIIRLLVEHSTPRSFTDAIRFENEQRRKPLVFHNSPEFGVAWDFTVKNPIPTSMDATSVVLCSLMRTRGNGQTIFNILLSRAFSLENAHRCDIGRALWFWASCQNFPLLTQAFIDTGFPIDLLASATSFPSYFYHDPRGPVLQTTALWNAAWNGADEVVRVLLDNRATLPNLLNSDANVDDGSQKGAKSHDLDALLAACQGLANERRHNGLGTIQSPSTESYALVVKHLIQHGADPKPRPTEQYYGTRRAFHRASPPLPPILEFAALGVTSAVRELVKAGADVHVTCNKGKSLLHYAIDSQSIELVSEVLEYQIPINAEDSYGYRPIHSCVLDGTVEMLQLLITNGADINARTHLGISALLMAVSVGKGDMIKSLLQNGADPNQSFTPSSAFKVELDLGHPTMTENFVACSPLLVALRRFAKFEHSEEMERTLGHRPDMAAPRALEILLEHDVDLNALGCVAYRNQHNRERPTCVWSFEWVYPYQYGIKAIFEHVEDPYMLGSYSIGEKVKQLVGVFAKLYKHGKIPRPILDVWMGNLCVSRAQPPLVYRDHSWLPPTILHYLLDLGASPNVQGSMGRTPLHVTCMPPPRVHDSQWGNEPEKINELICRLVSLGADINAQDSLGRTPLHYAVIYYPTATPILLDAGANPSIQDINRLNVLQYALECRDLNPQNSLKILDYMKDPNYFNKTLLFMAGTCRCPTPEIDKLLDQTFLRIQNHELPIFWSFDPNGNTVFHIAAMAKTWVERPIKVLCGRPQLWPAYCMQNRLGQTPLILATFQGFDRVVTVLRGVRMAVDGDRVKKIKLTEIDQFNSSNPTSSKMRFSQVFNDPRLEKFYADLEAGKSTEQGIRQQPWNQVLSQGRQQENNPPLEHTWGSEDEYTGSESNSDDEELSEAEKDQALGAQSLSHQSLGMVLEANNRSGKNEWMDWSDNESVYGSAKKKQRDYQSQERPAPAEARAQCLNTRDVHGWTALHYAANFGNHKIVKMLLEEPGLDICKEMGDANVPSTLLLAERSGDSECVRLISEALEERKGWKLAEENNKAPEESNESSWIDSSSVRIMVLVIAIVSIYIRSMGNTDTER